jgi:hypothetical protein
LQSARHAFPFPEKTQATKLAELRSSSLLLVFLPGQCFFKAPSSGSCAVGSEKDQRRRGQPGALSYRLGADRQAVQTSTADWFSGRWEPVAFYYIGVENVIAGIYCAGEAITGKTDFLSE